MLPPNSLIAIVIGDMTDQRSIEHRLCWPFLETIGRSVDDLRYIPVESTGITTGYL